MKVVLFAVVSVECTVDTVEELEAMKESLQDAPVGMCLNGMDVGVLETYE